MFKNMKFGSIEDASILRKFTVLFLLMSIIPIGVLFYFYLELKDSGSIKITEANFSTTLFLIVLGVAVGYWAMRSVLKSLIDITRSNRDALTAILGPEKIQELSEEKNEINVLARSFSEVTSRLEENIKSLEMAKKTLHSVLTRVGQGISSMHDIGSFLDLIVETVVDAFSARVGFLMLVDGTRNNLYLNAVYGVNVGPKSHIKLSADGKPFGEILKGNRPVIIDFLEEAFFKDDHYRALFKTPMLCAPLALHEHVIGILVVGGKHSGLTFQDDEKSLIHNLALQTAVAIENSQLNENVEKTYFETISALALAVDAKDRYSRGHLDRVADYVVRIAKAMQLSEENIKTLRNAARLHDVGKIGIPDEVLTKPAPLTIQEMDMMKKHPEIGESIIRPVRFLRNLCDIVRHHHEKLDGSGYPDGLKEDQISLLVRITTVADIYDALTTDRPYRKKYSFEDASKILRDMRGQLDQSVVETFLSTFNASGQPEQV
ncbi:MAG: hypothetical protein A2787_03510 [Omnitrophica WOR_2 bacterium RIFCSPHIGHO2_01_FULL_48_9]|nr:MAG: hypothetical protein A3D10_06030 [Omnitrophica WOR_2 bacterium RIFCSPHIGHO2_02_FULL_48_11]OGX31631.1 MAG: hypothetical protein A2787_03510 [Omnitrophica WOR_2 bacterium RIFCSPHIGHO2_01_FULL_48_9]